MTTDQQDGVVQTPTGGTPAASMPPKKPASTPALFVAMAALERALGCLDLAADRAQHLSTQNGLSALRARHISNLASDLRSAAAVCRKIVVARRTDPNAQFGEGAPTLDERG